MAFKKMKPMRLIIMTSGRPNTQTTFGDLPEVLRDDVFMVVGHGQGNAHARWEQYGAVVVERPAGLKGIAEARQWVMEQDWGTPYIVQLDDDIKFFTKTAPDRKIVKATPNQIIGMFHQLHLWMREDGLAHCSITPRFLNWQHPGPYMEAARQMHVHAFNVEKVHKAGASFTKGMPEFATMEDFHMTLQLLEAGLVNRVDTDNCTNPSASNAAGGCSVWRTVERANASAERLAQLHPQVVKVRIPKTSDWKGMEGKVRKDVTVQWQKAFKLSQKH